MNEMHLYKVIESEKINKLVCQFSLKVIDECERQYSQKLNNIVQTIKNSPESYKVLLLAGPSSSGKTTTAQNLRDGLRAEGIGAWSISLDDFFKDQENIKIKDGELDYESLDALDLDLIHKCLDQLIRTSESEFPVFDFINNKRSIFKRILKTNNSDIVILEGLHALNPKLLLPSYSKKCLRVYISVSTSFVSNNKTIITTKDLRLIRRIIRDYKFRNTHPYETLKMWSNVCAGEIKYIEPFKESAQIFIDSCITYEPCIFHKYLDNIIQELDKTNIYYNQILKIYNKLLYFNKLDSSVIPPNSILREFVGPT
ncbi:MAG: nucleoside kinase [Oscillospiraceae bacterium]|nr:nucleoside kinase [Oscillospiraceae bacterium]